MKTVVLALYGLSLVYSAEYKCSRPGAMESFILSTNALPAPNVYKRLLGSSVVECTRSCLDESNCRSFTFIRRHDETECRMTSNAPDRSRMRQEDMTLTLASGTYFMEKICLKGACDRLFVAESLRGMELEEHDDVILANRTRLSCLESCLGTKEILCRSVEFDSKTAECRLSRHDRFDRKSHFRKASSASIEYFDVTCPYQQGEEQSAEIIPLGNVEHPYSLVEYEGVTAQECGELCLQNILFPCRSFLSGRVHGKLYCGLTHQNREGLVQNPAGIATSRSINYYEIGRNVEACDPDDLHFELMSGTILDVTPYAVALDLNPQECVERCKRDRRCRSVGVDYRKGACQYNSESIGHAPDASSHLQQNDLFNYFEKVCLPGSRCIRDWAFERSRNKELIGIDHDKVVVEAHTKEECQMACLHHKGFVCLSAEFNYQMKECRLSPYNRFSSTDKAVALTNSRFTIDYFENNCAKEPRGFCNTRLIKKVKMLLPEKTVLAESIEDCRQYCYDNEEFICRSVTYDHRYKLCGMSHHTRRSAPLESITRADGQEFIEISTCFDVSVDCRQDLMLANIKTNTLFKGKVYTKDRPLSCFADVTNTLEFTLPISLTAPECGTVSKVSRFTHSLRHDTKVPVLIRKAEGEFSNILVIQSNDHVVTAMDKAIGVHCYFDVGNKTEQTDIHIMDPGSSDRSRGSPTLPDLSLHIVDMKGEERDTVSLGELLRVQVRMSDEDTYGIFVRNLVAKDGSGANNLTLIDNTGCPAEIKMMREVRTIAPQSKSLEGYLEAFTFTGSSLLELEAEVETCLETCKPVVCQIPTGRRDDDIETVNSYGRRKRDASILSSITLSRTVATQAEDFESAKMLHTDNYASPVTAPTSMDMIEGGLFHPFGQFQPGAKDNTFCFDPTLFALVAGGFFLVEVCGFSACLVAACRWKSKKPKPIVQKKCHMSIHYENSADVSAR